MKFMRDDFHKIIKNKRKYFFLYKKKSYFYFIGKKTSVVYESMSGGAHIFLRNNIVYTFKAVFLLSWNNIFEFDLKKITFPLVI